MRTRPPTRRHLRHSFAQERSDGRLHGARQRRNPPGDVCHEHTLLPLMARGGIGALAKNFDRPRSPQRTGVTDLAPCITVNLPDQQAEILGHKRRIARRRISLFLSVCFCLCSVLGDGHRLSFIGASRAIPNGIPKLAASGRNSPICPARKLRGRYSRRGDARADIGGVCWGIADESDMRAPATSDPTATQARRTRD